VKIYCFSGLGADERVFDFLEIDSNYELVPVKWIDPLLNESIEDYSLRISKNIMDENPFGILGVSFGGLVAQEVSKVLNSKFTFVISSISKPSEIPFLLRFIPNIFFKILPKKFFCLPHFMANFFFSANNKKLLSQILRDANPNFTKWALIAFKKWKSQNILLNVFFISGSKDRLIKPVKGAVNIPNGGHFMIVDSAGEVSSRINDLLNQINQEVETNL